MSQHLSKEKCIRMFHEEHRALFASILCGFDRVYFDPLQGNNGDKLIEMGARKLLGDLGKTVVPTPESAQAIILNGGGGKPGQLFHHIRAGHKDIIVLPSTFHSPHGELEALRGMSDASKCNLVLVARDKESYGRLYKAFGDHGSIHLSHDMAFYLEQNHLKVPRRRLNRKQDYALVVERRDAEASTCIETQRAWPIPLKAAVPTWLKRPVKRALTRRMHHDSAFARQCISQMEATGSSLPIEYGDVSDSSLFSFEDFLYLCANAREVFTTRLHVAILRSVLGLGCHLVPTGGDYRKNESVHEHSLAQQGNIRLIECSQGSSRNGSPAHACLRYKP
jgi:exopolysaccharide biosynthesis predicted pyruvyltransferase EpsI